MPGSRKIMPRSNCKNKIVGSDCQEKSDKLEEAAYHEFYGTKPRPPKRYFDDRECRPDIEIRSDSEVTIPIKIPKPNIKQPRKSSCYYGGKPKKRKTKKAKKSKKVRKTNKSRKSTNFLFNLFK